MFYIKPPRGHVSLHVLEKCVFARLEYLQLLYHDRQHEFAGDFEYLLENSIYDKIGHFALRLIASTSADLWSYWIGKETLLFQNRLNSILPRQLHKLLRTILRQLRTLEDSKLVSTTLIDVCALFLKPVVLRHLVSKDHSQYCDVFQCKVRFELVPDLVKAREVDLTSGYAIIRCSQWRQALLSLFCTYTAEEATSKKALAWHSINYDHRLTCLYQKVHRRVFNKSFQSGRITNDNIDTKVYNFPPCMQHLHMKLRTSHRLSHYARYYYSLFLKECGMNLEDAIYYWKQEYSKPHTCSSTCSHSWQTSERKFIYSIRHLYGLEGSRKNYKTPDCEHICAGIAGPTYEGGCPFKNFDPTTLKTLLCSSMAEDEATILLNAISSEKPQTSCSEFFKRLHNQYEGSIVINSPVEYYLLAVNRQE